MLIADSVGLGKTGIGKKLLEDYAYHMRQKALVICPACLRLMWQRSFLTRLSPRPFCARRAWARGLSMFSRLGDADVVLVDESHNFRNREASATRTLSADGLKRGRGRDGLRKKVVLLTATPMNNDLFDLYNQFRSSPRETGATLPPWALAICTAISFWHGGRAGRTCPG